MATSSGLDDILSWLLTDPNQPGGTQMAKWLGLASPTASTQTPTIVPSGTSPALSGPTLGGTPPATATASGGLLGGQLPHQGLLRGLLPHHGLLGDSPLGDMLQGAFQGLASVQPGQTGLAAIGAGAQGAMTADQERQQRQARDYYLNSLADREQRADVKDVAQQQAVEAAIAALPPDQQAAARADPDSFFQQYNRAKFATPEPPKTQTQHLPGGMDQDMTWNPDKKAWEPSGQPYARWAPQQPSQGDRTLVPIYDPNPANPTHQRLVPRPDAVGQPTGTPPTPRQPSIADVIQPIIAKVAAGTPLTPAEQKALDIYQHTSQIDQLIRDQQQGGGGQGGSQSQGGTQPAQPAPPPATPPTTLTSPAPPPATSPSPPLGQGNGGGGATSSGGTAGGAAGGTADRGGNQANPIPFDPSNGTATMQSIVTNNSTVWLQAPDGTVRQYDATAAAAWLAKHAPGQ